MGIKDLQLPQLTVETPGGSFAVRGVSPVEMEVLLREHRATFGALFTRVTSAGATLDAETLSSSIGLLTECPEVMARIIAMAADEPDSISHVMRLPLAIQIDALTKIASLTFTVEGDLGKLLGLLVTKISGIGQVLEKVSLVLEKVEKH